MYVTLKSGGGGRKEKMFFFLFGFCPKCGRARTDLEKVTGLAADELTDGTKKG